MESSKTKVLNFDEHWNGCCISSNCEEDEARFHFQSGQQSKQDEIDELQYKIDEALKLLNLAYPESCGYCVDEAINILTGE